MFVGFLKGLSNHLGILEFMFDLLQLSVYYEFTSAARLSLAYGRHSGLMLNLLHILFDMETRWYHTWLKLEDVGEGWYEI